MTVRSNKPEGREISLKTKLKTIKRTCKTPYGIEHVRVADMVDTRRDWLDYSIQ